MKIVMNKARNKIIGIIVVILIILLFLIIYNVVVVPSLTSRQGQQEKNDKQEIISFRTDQYRYLSFCDEGVSCPLGGMEYPSISTSNAKLKTLVSTINDNISDAYLKSEASTVDPLECATYSDVLIHDTAVTNSLNVYQDDSLVVIGFGTVEKNLCTDTILSNTYEVSYYDVENDEFFTQEEFVKRYHINEGEVVSAIEENIADRSEDEESNYTFDANQEYYLFVNYDGQIMVSYRVLENSINYTAFIGKSVG